MTDPALLREVLDRLRAGEPMHLLLVGGDGVPAREIVLTAGAAARLRRGVISELDGELQAIVAYAEQPIVDPETAQP